MWPASGCPPVSHDVAMARYRNTTTVWWKAGDLTDGSPGNGGIGSEESRGRDILSRALDTVAG
jgi:hypothetical protein